MNALLKFAQEQDSAPDSDELTVLTHTSPWLAKKWLRTGGIVGHQEPKFFKCKSVPVRGIVELSGLLKTLLSDPHSCVIRGKYRGSDIEKAEAAKAMEALTQHHELALSRVQAAADAGDFELQKKETAIATELGAKLSLDKHFQPGKVRKTNYAFADQPLHALMIDIDKYSPLAADPCSVEAIQEFIEKALPAEFHRASYFYQFSASAGHADKPGTRAHVWFWLTTPATSAQLKQWAKALPGDVRVDPVVYQQVQIHYTSGPQLEAGLVDPLPQRGALVRGEHDAVTIAIPLAVEPIEQPRFSGAQISPGDDLGLIDLADRGMLLGGPVSTSKGIAYPCECPFENEHSGRGNDSATYYYPPRENENRMYGGFACQRGHCDDRPQKAYHDKLGWTEAEQLAIAAQFPVVEDPVDSQGQPLREPTIRERIEQCGNAAAILDLLHGVDREMIDEKDLGVLKEQSKKTLNASGVNMTIREIDAEIGRDRRLTPAQKRAIRAAESDAPDPQSEHLARRREQQRKNVELQAGGAVEFAQVMTVEQMEQQLVYVKEGQVVASLVNPRMALLNAEFSRAYKASVHFVHSKSGAQKKVKNTETWFESEERITVETRTFRAGGNPITTDPDGKSAINSWRSTKRPESTASAQPFIEQVRFLFKQDTEKFLDWLAHIEQKPGELPHYGFLHISKMHGTGRNWLASVLARVWRGYVAPNVDLAGLLNSAFNGELSGRILAQVDEIREGGTDTFRHAQLLKSIVNPEFRLINPKFGRQYKEFNSCRWLAFSQHDNALPLEDNDRRWWVVKCTEQPRPPEVYTALYKLIDNEQFVNAVANMLASRDIRTFNAGERPPLSEAKRAAIQASKSSFGRLADELVRYWPSDLIINPDVANTMLEGVAGSIGRGPTLPMRRSLEDAGCQHGHGGKPVKVGGKIEKFWILRNVDRWSVAAPHEITRELGNVSSEFGYCAYDVLLDAMADAELGDLI